MTDNAKRELTRPETQAVFLHLLKIQIEGEDPFYFVDNNEYIRSGGIDWAPVAFEIALPEDEKTPCSIRIDDTDRIVSEKIIRNRNKRISATVSVIMSTSPNAIEAGPFELILRNVTLENSVVTANLYDLYIYDRKIPEGSYKPQDFPGLF